MADIIAMDETVFRDVYVANEDELWEADDFKSNQDKVQNDIYTGVQQTETIAQYLLCTNIVACMLRDCYNLCEQAANTFREIGDTLLELDETIHITLHGEEAYYEGRREE